MRAEPADEGPDTSRKRRGKRGRRTDADRAQLELHVRDLSTRFDMELRESQFVEREVMGMYLAAVAALDPGTPRALDAQPETH